jgi:hypothetical protein
VAARGIDLFLYDHTITHLPLPIPRARFFRTGIRGAEPVAEQRTLAEVLADNGRSGRRDLVVKMDIEGAEWPVLEEISPAILDCFAQIVVEFHGLGAVVTPSGHDRIAAALSKLASTHQAIHVHGKCYDPRIWIGDLVLPEILEVSYVLAPTMQASSSRARRYFQPPSIGQMYRTCPTCSSGTPSARAADLC